VISIAVSFREKPDAAHGGVVAAAAICGTRGSSSGDSARRLRRFEPAIADAVTAAARPRASTPSAPDDSAITDRHRGDGALDDSRPWCSIGVGDLGSWEALADLPAGNQARGQTIAIDRATTAVDGRRRGGCSASGARRRAVKTVLVVPSDRECVDRRELARRRSDDLLCARR
jgi:hypothetical protein